jgi:hypothetical protein
VARLVVGDPQPVTVTLRTGEEGTPVAATGTVTVTVTNDAGTAIATAAATSAVSGSTGVYSWTPTAAMLDQADLWILVWSDKTGSTVNRQLTTYVEVTGARTLTAYELRERYPDLFGPVGSTGQARWPTAKLSDAIAAAERRAEQIMRRSVVPRYGRLEVTGDGDSKLFLPRPNLRELRSVTLDGDELDLDDDITILHADVCPVLSYGTWTKSAPIVVLYEYGLDYPTSTVVDAIAMTARAVATRSTSGAPDKAERWQPAGQGGFFMLATPDMNRVGLPEADAIFEAERWRGGDLW